MPFGHLTDEMRKTMAPFVRGRTVWDLGAGGLAYACELVVAGASRVVAIDKTFEWVRKDDLPNNIELVERYFQHVEIPEDGIEVALVSWPVNHPGTGIRRLMRAAKKVIYIGSNTDGNACGSVSMFLDLTSRELLAHVPHRRNSLMVYGDTVGLRPRVPEECAALQMELLQFEEAEELARQYPLPLHAW